jgi:hypothetical protein
LIDSLNNGIAEVVFANGNISFYQISTNTIRLLSVVVGYFVLKAGFPIYYLFVCYIVASLFIVLFKQISLKKINDINNILVIKKSLLPSIVITIISLPIFFFDLELNPFINIAIKELYVLIIIFFLGLSSSEKRYIYNYFKKRK